MASFNAGHNKPELSRSHADLRLKMGQKNEELASIPSEITEDEWAEIQRFHQEQHNEAQRKEKASHMQKRSMVKEILDKQLQERKAQMRQEYSQ